MSPLAARSMCVTGGWIREVHVMHSLLYSLGALSFHIPHPCPFMPLKRLWWTAVTKSNIAFWFEPQSWAPISMFFGFNVRNVKTRGKILIYIYFLLIFKNITRENILVWDFQHCSQKFEHKKKRGGSRIWACPIGPKKRDRQNRGDHRAGGRRQRVEG